MTGDVCSRCGYPRTRTACARCLHVEQQSAASLLDVFAEAGKRLQWLHPWGDNELADRWRDLLRDLYEVSPKPPGFNTNTTEYVAVLERVREALDA